MALDTRKSLQQLNGRDWGARAQDARVETECRRLRRVPLASLTVEDLRLLIGLAIGLEYLVPLALERLAEEPFVAGDLYPGDLLHAVLTIPATFWARKPEVRE